jgi:hypothetical protein
MRKICQCPVSSSQEIEMIHLIGATLIGFFAMLLWCWMVER